MRLPSHSPRRFFFASILFCLLGSCSARQAPIAAPAGVAISHLQPASENTPLLEFNINVKQYSRQDTPLISTETEGDNAIIQIYSQSGIGEANVRVTSKQNPVNIFLRFHLQNLETLEFAYGDRVISLSVDKENGFNAKEQVRVATSSFGSVLSLQNNQYWMNGRLVWKGTGQQLNALLDFIELQAPADYLDGGYRQFSIRWVDYYR